MPSETTSWTTLARLIRPQGRKGELLADLFTDFPERFTTRKGMFLIPPGFTGDISSAMPIEITSSWLPVGKNKGRVVLHLAGIDTISEAETRTGFEIAIPDDQRTPLEDESLYISDLIGCSLFDRTENIGTVTEVEFPATSDGSKIPDAPALIAVQTGNDQEILIPFVKAFIQEIDLPARRLVMNLPAGLIEMNQKI